jgi:hypothetical protein
MNGRITSLMKEPHQQDTLAKEENLSLLKRLERPSKKYIYPSDYERQHMKASNKAKG